MLGYYLNLALRSFRRNKALTALMVLAIALGIGASMTTLTVFHVLSGDPIPQKSDRLFYVQLDPESMRGYRAGEEPQTQMTRFDSETLLKQKRGLRQTLTAGGNVVVTPDKADVSPRLVDARDALEFILAGATAVQIGTANFVDPFVWTKVLTGLEEYLDRHRLDRIDDLIGAFDPTPPKAVHA